MRPWLLFLLPFSVHAIHIPLYSQPKLQRRAQIGLGDYVDVTYSVLVEVGGVLTPLVLDTGSSDLWVISTSCKGSKDCATSLPLYPEQNFKPTGLDVALFYGDSMTGTHAFGAIGLDKVSLAGLTAESQYFAAIDDTNTSVVDYGATGIFGLGFPVNSRIWSDVFKSQNQLNARRAVEGEKEFDLGTSTFPSLGSLYPIPPRHDSSHEPSLNLKRPRFPSVSSLYPSLQSRQSSDSAEPSAQQAWTQKILSSFSSIGPLLSRLALSNSSTKLSDPTFTISLQRNSIANAPTETTGILSIGEFPSGLTNDSFTWTPIRLYTTDEGGLFSPTTSPQEVYPIAWEIYLEDVYIDGQVLPRSRLGSPDIALSALVDTGNSLIRGPQDIVREIRTRIGISGSSGTFPCATPHSLAFKIAGKMFPVDPRDFISQAFNGNSEDCISNVVATDPPSDGKGYKYSWSLGAPFLKSVVASYHYGNITHPTRDPPRLGFVSTVPADSQQKLKDAIAQASGGDFFATSNPAPTGLPTGSGGQVNPVPSATSGPDGASKNNGALRIGMWAGHDQSSRWSMLGLGLVLAWTGVLMV